MRVLHVVLNLEAGGLERLVVDLANRLDRDQFESHVLVLQYPGRHADELRSDVTLHTAPRSSKWSMLRPASLTRAIRTIRPDLVHTHSGVWHKASLAARGAGVTRTIHTDHGRVFPDPWRDRITDVLAARRTDVVVAVSEPLGEYMHRALRVPISKLRVVQNGVNVDDGAPGGDGRAIRAELGLYETTPVIGSVGRLDSIKGYDVLIEAYGRLREGWTGVCPPVLVIAGDGPERLRLREQVASLDENIRGDVHLLGWRTDVSDLLAAFDIFALASHSEGTSVSLLEAMSARVCPVVTDVGGNAMVLGNELCHRLVPPGDPTALARGLSDAVRYPGARRHDANRARARVEVRFSLSAMVRRYENLYLALTPA